MSRLFAGTPFDIPPRCDRCDQTESDCRCTAEEKAADQERIRRELARRPPREQTARITIEKRKGNRRVTLISGLSAEANDLGAVLSGLQTHCGAGGTLKTDPDVIELQGDHAVRAADHLRAAGYRLAK